MTDAGIVRPCRRKTLAIDVLLKADIMSRLACKSSMAARKKYLIGTNS
jgi:hypothetical protein